MQFNISNLVIFNRTVLVTLVLGFIVLLLKSDCLFVMGVSLQSTSFEEKTAVLLPRTEVTFVFYKSRQP